MGVESIFFLTLSIALGFYVAWNIGANDVSNAMGTSVGARALTLRQAVVLAAIFEFAGAMLLGSHVTSTLEEGIVNPLLFQEHPLLLGYGMVAALLSTGIWLQIASYFGWPVSTTHTIVGAILGFGLIAGGPTSIEWGKIISIGSSWIVSPVCAGIIAFLLFTLLKQKVFHAHRPLQRAKAIAPAVAFLSFAVVTFLLLYQKQAFSSSSWSFTQAFLIALAIGCLAALLFWRLVSNIRSALPPIAAANLATNPQVTLGLKKAIQHLQRASAGSSGPLMRRINVLMEETQDCNKTAQEEAVEPPSAEQAEYVAVEKVFTYLQIMTACMMAFAHGANDVANAIGPLSAAIAIFTHGVRGIIGTVPLWILLLGATGIVIGLATWGWRVIETVGKKITELTPSRGFSAEFGAAITVVVASRLGLPISTTHALVGAILGVGLARGIGALNLSTIRGIFASWLITVPVGALLSIGFYELILFLL